MQILFQLPIASNAPVELPAHIHFVVHLASWRMETHHEPELRQKVITVNVTPGGDADAHTLARGRLNLHDVIGLHASPLGAIWRLADKATGSAFTTTPKFASGRPSLGSPAGARSPQVMPTLVVHVPSNLNPSFHDARIAFGARTMSWLHELLHAVDGRALETSRGPRVIVPLHMQAHAKTPAMPRHVASPRHALLSHMSPRQQVSSGPPAEWSEGALAFPLHGATARERQPQDGWRWRSVSAQPAVPLAKPLPMCQVPPEYEYFPGRIDEFFALPAPAAAPAFDAVEGVPSPETSGTMSSMLISPSPTPPSAQRSQPSSPRANAHARDSPFLELDPVVGEWAVLQEEWAWCI